MWKKVLPLLFLASVANAQTFSISTVAGGGPATGQSATSYGFNSPGAVAVDPTGNVYFALPNSCQVWEMNPSGTVTQVIGNGACGYAGDGGSPAMASLNFPYGIAVDGSGNLYIADTQNFRIRKVSGGIITTVAGNGIQGSSGDSGSATSAELNNPYGVGVDSAGTNIYIADTGNQKVRKVTGGIITTFAGTGTAGYNGDSISATTAELNNPQATCVDSSGNVYIADTHNERVRKVSGGTITTFAGTSTAGYNGDSISATTAELSYPEAVAIDTSLNLYIADTENGRVRKVSGGIITSLASGLILDEGVAVGGGNVYVAESYNNLIGKVSSGGGGLTTVAGNGLPFGGDGASATSAEITFPVRTAVDSGGDLFIADTYDCVVRKVTSGGTISTVAGNGMCNYSGDGSSATSAGLNYPYGIALDSSGNLYIADTLNYRIRKVTGGTITTVAGNGTAGYNGDNISATSAELNYPYGVVVDSSGNLYIADTLNSRIRKVSGGTITTVAGTGTSGYNGDMSATSAELNVPWDVTVDSSGNLYIADTDNNRIRKVSGGNLTTVAGGGTSGLGDGGPATSAELNFPEGVAVDSSGNIYIGDRSNQRIREVVGGTITTIAGNGTYGFSGDGGAATAAELADPIGVAVDSGGNVYVADLENNRIRKLIPAATVAVTVTSTPSGLSVVVDGTSYTTPHLFNFPSGASQTFSASAQPGPTGVQYVPGSFPSSQSFSANGTFNIPFTTQYYLTTSAGTGGTIVPASEFVNSGSGVVVTATPNSGYTFAGFTGALSGTTNPQTVTMNAPESVTATFTTTPCTYSLTPTSASVIAGASSGSVTVTATPASCGWGSVNPLPWVNITTGASGTGNGTLNYNVVNNPNSGSRTGTLTIATQPFTLTQAGQGCQVGFTPSSASVGSSGASGKTVNVGLSGADCQWTASSSVPSPSWVTINSGGSGTGNGTINYSVSANPSSISRSGAINVNVSTIVTQAAFNINEAGTTCSYALTQSSQSFLAAGGNGTATVVSPGGCTWSVSGNPSWVVITSTGPGAGDGTVTYTVQANTSTVARIATLTIAGQTYVVTQAGVTPAPLSCTVNVPTMPQVALEGRTEILGDLLLNCTGLSSTITADILLTLNTNVTNQVTAGLTDAMLVNGSATQNGQVLGYTTVHWPGVTLTPSGGNGAASVRLTNVRADASLLAVGSNLQPAAITGQLTVNSTVAVPITNASQILANAVTTLAFSVGAANSSSDETGMFLPVSYQEATLTAFHVASGSTPATRFRMVLTNIPSSVLVYAPVYPTGGATQGQLYSAADCTGSGGTPAIGISLQGAAYSPLSVTGGVATATWVVLSANANSIDTLTFPLFFQNASTSNLNQIQVVGSFAPVSPPGVACGSTDPAASTVPRYRDFSVPQVLVNVRLTTSMTATITSAELKVAEMPRRAGGEAAKPAVKVSPQIVQPSVTVSFGATLANESSSQPITNGKIGGSVPTGSNQISCSATGGGTCTPSGGEYSCSYPSIPAGESVSCSGSGQLDPTYAPGSTVTNSAGASGDQPPADPSTAESSSSITVPNFPPNVLSEAPVQSSTVSGIITVSGWAVDAESLIGSVQIEVDGSVVGTATYGINRPDVCSSFVGFPGCPNVGFTYSLPTYALGNGPHTITAVATDTDAVPVSATSSVTVAVQNPGFTVSGAVTLGSVGLSGVTINVTGSTTFSSPTNASGNYSFTLGTGGTYTLTPVLSGYSFTPGSFTFSNLSANQTGNFIATPGGELEFYPVTPCRIADTRSVAGFTGQFGPPSLAAGTPGIRAFNILSSPCATGIPASVAAYSLNFTVVPPAGGPEANLTTWPAGLGLPNVSTVNYYGSVVANAAIVPAGTNGAIDVFVSFPTDMLMDINGYFAPPGSSGLEFYPVTPCRIADTRSVAGFTGQFGPPSLVAGTAGIRTFNLLSSSCTTGIPTSVAAYSLNFTAVPPAGGPEANLTTWPAGQGLPNVSTVNYYGSVVANAAIVPSGTNDAISVFASYPTDMLMDINGYFGPPLASGLHFYPVTPCRIADTRSVAGFTGQFGPPSLAGGAAGIRTFNVLSSSCTTGIPASVAAYSLNFTVVPPAGGPEANLTTWPTALATGMPNVSTLNYYGSVVAGAAIVPAGTNGAINVFVSFPTDMLMDINGYFAP